MPGRGAVGRDTANLCSRAQPTCVLWGGTVRAGAVPEPSVTGIAGTIAGRRKPMRLRAAISAFVAVPVLALAACAAPAASGSGSSAGSASASGSSGSAASSASSGSSASSASSAADSSSASPTALGPSIPAETAIAQPVARDRMPTATGSFGEKPTITMPSTPPPDTLQRVVLSKGDGPVSSAGSWLQVNYLGQVWGGKVFDTSYGESSAFLFQLGASPRQVVTGWDIGLRGVPQGSRVMLSFPPQDGYGSQGKEPDISGTDTLVFVVDVVKVIPADASGDANAAAQPTPSGLPSVGGKPGGVPTVSVPTSLPEPTKTTVTVLDKGTGDPVKAGDVLVQYAVTTWDGSEKHQSWPDPSSGSTEGIGPQELGIQKGTPFEALLGVPMGSRVLVTMAADSSQGTPALAWVMDLVMQKDLAPATTGSGAPTTGSSGAAPTEGSAGSSSAGSSAAPPTT